MDGSGKFVERRRRRFALREVLEVIGTPRRFAIIVAIGFVFGWIGPYGTFQDLELPARMAYWVVSMVLTYIPVSLTIRTLVRTEPSASWPPPLQALTGAVISGVPSTFICIAVGSLFHLHERPMPLGLLQTYIAVTVMIALISIPLTIIFHREREAAPDPQPPPTPPAGTSGGAMNGSALTHSNGASPFLRRLPPRLGGALLCIETEDHYLRVTTEQGSDLILFRLGDAIAELDPAAGLQVHRSYWVARRAVASVERNGHRTTLVLSNGARVPVSRTYLPALREAGWLTA